MKPRVLIVITSDPRTSARPAEAVRIAAGVGAWNHAQITLYLDGPAILVLGEDSEELIDGDNFIRYLQLVAESSPAICVQKDSPFLAQAGESRWKLEALDESSLAALAAQNNYLLRF